MKTYAGYQEDFCQEVLALEVRVGRSMNPFWVLEVAMIAPYINTTEKVKLSLHLIYQYVMRAYGVEV
jgi:hypothetical protein